MILTITTIIIIIIIIIIVGRKGGEAEETHEWSGVIGKEKEEGWTGNEVGVGDRENDEKEKEEEEGNFVSITSAHRTRSGDGSSILHTPIV